MREESGEIRWKESEEEQAEVRFEQEERLKG